MKRLSFALLLVFLTIVSWYTLHIKEQRLQVEQLLWVEFDAAMQGLVRMLYLAEASPDTARAPLLAAYEHALVIRRLGPVAEQLLAWRGVQAEPLAGYILSLTGGVGSICEQAHESGRADRAWIAEIRQRIEAVHDIINAETMRTPNHKRLQHDIQALFGSETAVYFTTNVGALLPCSMPAW